MPITVPPEKLMFPTPTGFVLVNGPWTNGTYDGRRGFGLVTHDEKIDGIPVETHRYFLTKDYRAPGGRYNALARLQPYAGKDLTPNLEYWSKCVAAHHTDCDEEPRTGLIDDHLVEPAVGEPGFQHAANSGPYPDIDPFEYLKCTVAPGGDTFEIPGGLVMLQVDPQWIVGLYAFGRYSGRPIGYVYADRTSTTVRTEYWAVTNYKAFAAACPNTTSEATLRESRLHPLSFYREQEVLKAADALKILNDRLKAAAPDPRTFTLKVERTLSALPKAL